MVIQLQDQQEYNIRA